MTKKDWYYEWRNLKIMLEPMVNKADELQREYNSTHDRFTSLVAQGRHPNVERFREKLWDLEGQALKNYESSRTLLRGRGQVVMDKLREADPQNFQPDGWLMKHDHIKDTLNSFHPIDLIHAGPSAPVTTTSNTFLNVVDIDSPIICKQFSPTSDQLEGLEELQNNIIFYFAIILFCVTWIFVLLLVKLARFCISNKNINHFKLVYSSLNLPPVLRNAFLSYILLYLKLDATKPIGSGRYLITANLLIALWLFTYSCD